MSKLTLNYIDSHTDKIHTQESFSRALVEQILKAAREQIHLSGEKESISIAAEFKITPFEPAGCIRICGTVNGVTVCYHVNT